MRLEAKIETGLASLKADVLKVAIVIANAALTVALIKLLPQAAP